MTENTNTVPTDAADEPRLTSPYPGAKYHAPDCMRITIDVPKDAVQTIRLVNLSRGFLYIALQNFIQSLVNDCKRNNWTITNARDLEADVLNRCSTIVGDVMPHAGRDRPHEDERLRAGVVRQDGASTANSGATRQRKQAKANNQGAGVVG